MLKLRELIKKVRACKTAEEERSVINKESAEMRNGGKDANNQTKCRNIFKCVFMHMMGYSTTFIQVPVINLLASSNYTEKRMAYLALCLLLDEKSEVLLLSTQTIKKDLESSNSSIVAMALNAIGEVFTADMCRELASEVRKLMKNSSSYIKKKAACAGAKIIRKCPELLESFIDCLYNYFEDRNHGVLICGLSLAIQIFRLDPSQIKKFNKYHNLLAKYIKNLISVSYSPEFDVNGITDPFLQAKILEALQFFGKDNKEVSEDIRDVLSSVSNSIEGSKNTGNAILYELVKTINGIEADTGLKSLASTILGKFLTNRDNNFKYIALNTLREVVKTDVQSVQKHKNTILECLKDNDISIKRRALDLVYLIVNTSNIKQITKECINFLLTAENELKIELTTKISQSVEKYSPSLKWKIDTLIKMACLSGNYVTEDTVSSIINTIITAQELKIYSVHKCYLALKNNLTQEALAKVAIYVIGEFGDILINNSVLSPEDEQIRVTEFEVLDVLTQLEHANFSSSTVKEYLMNCYVKLANKFSQQSACKINSLLVDETKSFYCEVQERAVEYNTFARLVNENLRREVTKNIPNAKINEEIYNSKIDLEDTDIEGENEGEISPEEKKLMIKFTTNSVVVPVNKGGIDLDIFGGVKINNTINTCNSFPSNNNQINLLDNLVGIFNPININNSNTPNNNQMVNLLGEFAVNSNTTAQPMNENNKENDIMKNLFSAYNSSNTMPISSINNMDTLNLSSSSNFPLNSPPQVYPSSNSSMKETYRGNDISIFYSYNKQMDQSYLGSIYVSNNTDKQFTNVNLKFMVLKFVNLKVLATSGTTLEPRQSLGIKKDFQMTSNEPGKKIVMKIKFSYLNEFNSETSDTITIDDFN